MTGLFARTERFDRVDSTNDVVRGWLAAGTAEVCLAVAAEQTAGRGRAGRGWVAPNGAALLLSLGFRPGWLAPDHVWRLAAVASMAMADAAEATTGLAAGSVRLKWPNDLVIATPTASGLPADLRKVAGVLGETDGLGSPDPRAIIGLGVNVDWDAADFPPELAGAMTSLREAGGGRPIDTEALLAAFLERLEPGIDSLRGDRFDAIAWAGRQVTTGRTVRLETPGGFETATARGVDTDTGALILGDRDGDGGERHVLVGEIVHVRLAEPIAERV
ncbi:MAG: BirA family transcriptional regulator [Chloroflexota bacterium]|nr:BirA family transcriptional regulator [Chloroflexota bacterium]